MDAALGISVALLRPLAELLGRMGEPAGALLAALGVADATAPNTYLDAALVDRELAAIASRREDPAFAITLARASVARPLGMFSHMVWLSGTLRDALTRGAQRWAVVTQRTRMELDDHGGDVATLRSYPVNPRASRGRILTEFPFISLALRARQATSDAVQIRAVTFTHAGEVTPEYVDVFRAPVTFGAAVDGVAFERSSLDLPLAGADPLTSGVLESRVAELTMAAPEDPFVARVRAAIAAHVAAEPSPEVIARELGISARTLRRHLEQRGETVRSVLDEVRRERADTLLASGSSVKEVAFALGFSEPSAFSRAYKRWTGRAPNTPAT